MSRIAVHAAGTALLVTLCTLGFGVPAVHAGHEKHGHDHGERKTKDPAAYVAKLTEKLSLSEEQSAQVTVMLAEHHAKIKPITEQIATLHAQVGELKQAKHDAIKAILTPEQQVQFAEMGAEKRGHFKHGPDCSCESCALKRAESSESDEE